MDEVTKLLGDIKEMLRNQNYLVSMTPTQDGCIARFPRRTMHPIHSDFEATYIIKYGKDGGVFFELNFPDGKVVEDKIECPDYACQAMLIGHVSYLSRTIDYHPCLIECLDTNNNILSDKRFISALKKPNSTAVRRRQTKLFNLCEKWMSSTESRPAVEKEVEKLKLEEGFYGYLELVVGT